MNGMSWTGLTGIALVVLGCSAESDERKGQEPVSVSKEKIEVPAGPRYLRVRVAYDSGKFAVERVTWVDGELKQSRSGNPKNGLYYRAQLPNQATFWGSAPDPRSVHVEVPDAKGALTHYEAPAPGTQRFLIYVPADTQTVDFQAHPAAPTGKQPMAATATPGLQTLGSIDLRSFK
jgi:hypothetical protein